MAKALTKEDRAQAIIRYVSGSSASIRNIASALRLSVESVYRTVLGDERFVLIGITGGVSTYCVGLASDCGDRPVQINGLY